MSQWPFVIASYAVAAFGTVALTLGSLLSMRRAERAADALKRR